LLGSQLDLRVKGNIVAPHFSYHIYSYNEINNVLFDLQKAVISQSLPNGTIEILMEKYNLQNIFLRSFTSTTSQDSN